MLVFYGICPFYAFLMLCRQSVATLSAKDFVVNQNLIHANFKFVEV